MVRAEMRRLVKSRTVFSVAESALTVKKVDADTHTPLAEAEFRITKANGDFVGDYTTDASGIITVATLVYRR